MKGLKNNLRYWIVNVEKQSLYVFGLMTMLSVFYGFLWRENFTEVFLERIAMYLLMMIFLLVDAYSFGNFLIHFPMTISLGSDRKSSFIAMQLGQHLIVLQYMVVYALIKLPLWMKGDTESFGMIIMASLEGAFFLLGIGAVVGMVTAKFGRRAGNILYIGITFCVGMIFAMLLFSMENIIPVDFSWSMILVNPWLLLLGVIFDAVMIVVFYRCIRKVDLQFV